MVVLVFGVIYHRVYQVTRYAPNPAMGGCVTKWCTASQMQILLELTKRKEKLRPTSLMDLSKIIEVLKMTYFYSTIIYAIFYYTFVSSISSVFYSIEIHVSSIYSALFIVFMCLRSSLTKLFLKIFIL